MIDLKSKPSPTSVLEPMKEPAKRWRNKWRSNTWEFWGFKIHPSKDVAEQSASDWLKSDGARSWDHIEFLAAHPVEADQ